MVPTLKQGQLVWASSFKNPKVGDVVVAVQNGREVVKRVDAITDSWQVRLLGDNTQASTDSRQLGSIPKRHIQGVVFWPNTKR